MLINPKSRLLIRFVNSFWLLIIIALGVFSAAPTFAQTAPPSARDFAATTTRSFSLSPNGKKIVFLSGDGAAAQILLINLETMATNTIPVGVKDFLPRGVRWANDEYIILTVSFALNRDTSDGQTYQITRAFAISTINGTGNILMPSEDLQNNTNLAIEYMNYESPTIIVGALSYATGRGSSVTRLQEDTNKRLRETLYLTNLSTGRGQEIERGNANTTSWEFDGTGNVRIRKDIDVARNIASLWVKSGNSWRQLVEFQDALDVPFSIEGFLDANTALILQRRGDKRVAQKLDLNTGVISDAYTEERESIDWIEKDQYTHKPIALHYESLVPKVKWLDPELARLQTLLNNSFEGKFVYLSNWSKDKRKLIVGVESGAHQYQSYLFDTTTMEAELLSELPAAFETYSFSAKTLESFRARDGLKIPVFVTRPRDSAGKKMPTIIMPHGGPASADDAGFDYISQFMASRGYVVIQPQFRGSSGNGLAFLLAGYGEWGGKMQNDVSDSVKWAIDSGIADSARICIIGASYGGYAALVGATMTPELYACAVSFAGVSDLAAMQLNSERRGGRNSQGLAYWKEHMGLTRFDTEKIHAISPVHNAQNVRAPILLLHGEDDTIVAIDQSEKMASALRRAGKRYEFIELDGEDHHLSNSVTRERFLTEIEKFLAPILKPGE